jgi:hypothetical protein
MQYLTFLPERFIGAYLLYWVVANVRWIGGSWDRLLSYLVNFPTDLTATTKADYDLAIMTRSL